MTAKVFIKAASVGDIQPGKMKRVELNGRRIMIANIDGRFCAADDTCTHEEASLSKGFLKGDVVKCPLHGSRFNVRTGAVLDEPATEPLRTYPVKVDDDQIWVAVS